MSDLAIMKRPGVNGHPSLPEPLKSSLEADIPRFIAPAVEEQSRKSLYLQPNSGSF